MAYHFCKAFVLADLLARLRESVRLRPRADPPGSPHHASCSTPTESSAVVPYPPESGGIDQVAECQPLRTKEVDSDLLIRYADQFDNGACFQAPRLCRGHASSRSHARASLPAAALQQVTPGSILNLPGSTLATAWACAAGGADRHGL
jgi:hypothetical protein